MTGIVGGTAVDSELRSMVEALYREDGYDLDVSSAGHFGVGRAHLGVKDPAGTFIWRGGDKLAIVDGVIVGDDAPSDPETLVESVLERPTETLSALEGPFSVACLDAGSDELVFATDKSGSRPCYYTKADGFHFSSELKPLLPRVGSPTVDERAVADLLFLGAVIGEKTLIEQIHTLPPATYLRASGDTFESERYWYPEFTDDAPTNYVDGWIAEYHRSMTDLTQTIDGSLGVWLSGGIDSRVAAASLQRANQPFETFAYETGGGRDQAIAAAVARRLGVDHHHITDGTDSGEAYIH
ncbi:MAG: asparagine synthase-related protein, partial [Halobacteriota archaeon]